MSTASTPESAALSLPLSQTPAQATAKPGESALADRRNEAIDVVRLIAAAGIVFIHAARSPAITSIGHFFRFAVPFYLFASLYYQSWSLRRKPNRTWLRYVYVRFKRLYLPFLVWSAIYLIARDIKRTNLLQIGVVDLEWGLLWKGTEYHLYFLPLLLAWSIVLITIHWAFLRRHPAWRWPLIAIAIAGGFAFALVPMPSSWNETFPSPTYAYVQFWRAMPAACWGIAFAWFMTMGPRVYEVSLPLGLAGIVLAVTCSAIQVSKNGILLIPRALTGLGCMLAALVPWSGPTVSTLARLGRYSYGIYLCHVLAVEAIRAVAARGHFTATPVLDLAMFVVSFAASLALVLTLGRFRWLAWLNG